MLHLSSWKKEGFYFQSFGTSQEYYIKAYTKKETIFVKLNMYIFFDSNIHSEKQKNLAQNMN